MKDKLTNIINKCLDTGVDFADVFEEKKKYKTIKLIDSKINKVNINRVSGMGIRFIENGEVYYSAINDLSEENISIVIKELGSNIVGKSKEHILLTQKNDSLKKEPKWYYNSDALKKDYLLNIDKIARNIDPRINQVIAEMQETTQDVFIANTNGNYETERRYLTRLIITLVAKENDKSVQSTFSKGSSLGYEFLEDIDLEKEINTLAEVTIKKLSAPYAPSGKMPVVVGNGFGVMIHEACGHALEATSCADNISVLANKMGQKVASDCVTIIDDGTLRSLGGTTYIDDEGEKTRKNILVKNGIVTGYLVDKVNTKKMNLDVTGSSRRESYCLAPTSRMNNTYLDNGNKTFEEIIGSVDYGIYAKTMGGGQVNPITGDFNFAVNEAYMIRNGHIEEMVIGASLMGNTKEILNNIEMISNDLDFDLGYCGSVSGNVPVTCGQPTIKISEILVGGKDE